MLRFLNMKSWKLYTISIILVWLSACESHETILEVKPKIAPAVKTSTPDKASPSNESTLAKDSVKYAIKLFSPEIVGKPLAAGKFPS